jgi:AraC family transcriptional regulator, transcriptional activator of pobA
VLEAHLLRLLAGQATLARLLQRPEHLALAADDPAGGLLDASMAQLQAEHAGSQPWRSLALDAALLQVALALGRLAGQVSTPASQTAPRAQVHVQRFRALVDRHYRQQPALSVLAAELGITTTQLNRVCQQVLGQTALGVLHARLQLEAQRELAYTTLGIKQIALGLGFADAAYFTRFFHRLCGVTPSTWRAMAAR